MIKERIKKMAHYKPPLEGRSEKDYLLLDFNERTTAPGPKVKEALKKFIDSDRLQVYPEYGDLEKRIAKYAEVKPGEAMVTNGGDQGIDIVCRARLDQGDKVILPFPEFAMHYQSTGIQGAELLEPRYKEEGKLPLDEILELTDEEGVKLIIFSNPNNPTGIFTPISDIEKILEKARGKDIAVLHDEAYFEFSGITAKDLIEKYDNLYIIRTFAKAFGLVATRAGYILSQEENIQELKKIRGPYDVNMFAKTAIISALEDKKYMEDYLKEVMKKSKPKLEEFLREKGIFFYPSSANFLLLKVSNPEKIIEDFKSQGILLRPKPAPDGKEAVRVSIGTLKDTDRFIQVYSKLLTG
ncbi:MAG: histidinol-phosphate aminotransferase [Candidatus Nealsonbacteria bacterium CG_4_10_14_0_2_um_filter_37_10]|uniref:Histidinol-phosphate aminotransferase n=1 Tax=Candidatus Nealsonbacteria bacterium CG_4_10_14_0_2_um_filter_37_10 TaxID=1974679 RepID=A0A2M7UZJ2_9BACT|nr:MAG: histidinol-phosphate aminotransferase [Candidatus Nealsonbacteria bacterium CG_4_10_14_0_2_um_filter_37_10]